MATPEVIAEQEALAHINADYAERYGFHDAENYLYKAPKGINREIVEKISELKSEPQWMREFRLKSLEHFLAYGDWLAARVVPDLDTRRVAQVVREGSGFSVALDDGDRVHAERVVLAVGLHNMERAVPEFADLPEGTVSHVVDHEDLSVFAGRRVLVVEDEYMLAEDLREELERAGAEVLGPVPSVKKALEILQSEPRPDMALLDINLQGEMAWPVADLLRNTGIPFIFATGYDAKAIPPRYADVPRTEKPVALRNLGAAMHG